MKPVHDVHLYVITERGRGKEAEAGKCNTEAIT